MARKPLPSEVLTLGPDGARAAHAHAMVHRFTAAVDHIDQGLLLVGGDGRIAAANRKARTLLELADSDLAERARFRAVMARLQASGAFKTGLPEGSDSWANNEIWDQPPRYVRVRTDGRHVEVRTTRLDDGSCIRTYTDITDIHLREQALVAAEHEYRTLFENAVFGIYRTTLEGRQLRANPMLVKFNGYDTEAQLLAGVNDIAREWYVEPARRDLFVREMLQKGGVSDFVSQVYRHNTREKVWISETAWTVRDSAGRAICFEGMVVDATERVQSERRILELSRNDPLTGLANRRSFVEALAASIRFHRRQGLPMAICCIDLDRFKQVNDTQGHAAGDMLLRQIARRLKTFARGGRFIARIGGDEFAVIIPDAEETAVMAFANRLIGALSRPYVVQGQRNVIGASAGVAIAGPHKADSSDLMKMADIALYAAKGAGKGRAMQFRESMREPVHRRQRLEQALRRALSQGEIHLAYQPIADLQSGLVNCHEALMRWESADLGTISPEEFIPIAEETGLIHGLGQWALRQACVDASRRLPNRHVAVNISAVQLRSPHFRSHVLHALASSGLAPYELEIEITENVLLAHEPATLAVLKALKAMGVRIALDDFGTGWSSLSSLQNFTFDKIKIDRSFVADAIESPVNGAVVKAVIGLAADLGMELVAEGVETQAQAAHLLEAGCFLQQGYLHGRPFRLAKEPEQNTEPVALLTTQERAAKPGRSRAQAEPEDGSFRPAAASRSRR